MQNWLLSKKNMFHGAIPPLLAPGQHPPVLKCAAEAVARSLVRAVKGEHGTLEATGGFGGGFSMDERSGKIWK